PDMMHANGTPFGPSCLEFMRWIDIRLLDALVVVKIDQHAVAGGPRTLAAVIRPNRADTGIVDVAHCGAEPGKITKAHAFAAGAAGADDFEGAGFGWLHGAV